MLTRRGFLTTSSLALTGVRFGPSLSGGWAVSHPPGTRRIVLPPRAAVPVAHFLEPVAEPATMRTLAATAIDAARQAGADWADIRLGAGRVYRGKEALLTYNFGLRVRVGGVEAFVGGGDPTPARLVAGARSAVATARRLAQGLPSGGTSGLPLGLSTGETTGLTAVPAETGEWVAPMELDPFAVTVDEHEHVLYSLNGKDDVRLDQLNVQRNWWVEFRAETRVMASSEGTLLTQELRDVVVTRNSLSRLSWRLKGPGECLELPFPGYGSCTGGFEVVARLNRFAQIEHAAQELLRYESLPGKIVDVGRYPVVLDGVAHAAVLQSALVPALSLRRALWSDLDLGGSSPLRPVEEVLDQPRFSPLLSLQIDAAPPVFGACRWDAEGVPATGGPLISKGTVVNYIATRTTHALLAARLAAASPTRAVPPLLGGIVARRASDSPTEFPAALSMPAAAGGETLEALAKQLGTGVLVRGGTAMVNPEGTGGILYPVMMFEVKGGQLVRRLYGASLQFSTKKLFTSLKAVGNASTVGETTTRRAVGFPHNSIDSSLTAPAALYAGMDITNHQ